MSALGVLALAGTACRRPETPPDIVVVVIDTLRRDHVGAYGYPRQTSPTFDRLAREGTLFLRATAPSNWTVPSVASLLTGLEPWQHGAGIPGEVVNLDEQPPNKLDDSAPRLAGRLRSAGYATAIFSANPFLTQRFTKGFDEAQVGWVSAERLTESALTWLGSHRTSRRFLYLHYMDVHQPNRPPAPYFERFGLEPGETRPEEAADWFHRTQVDLTEPGFVTYRRHRIGAYDGAIRFVDDQLWRVVESLRAEDRLDGALLLVTADHGEELWDHAQIERRWADDPRGIWGVGHGHTFFEEVTAIPLLARGPGMPSGRRVLCPVSLLDFAPTIARAAGIPPEPTWAGRDLASTADPRCLERPMVSVSPAYGPSSSAIWIGSWKLIRRGERRLLFDLGSDPLERLDRAGERTRLAEDMSAALAARTRGPTVPSEPDDLGDDELARQLRALGYL